MRLKLIVKVSEQTGLSFVEVPHEDMWELVEHLSNQRSAVKYTYQADYFTVSFLHLDAAAVRGLLEEWNPSECCTDKESLVEAYAMAATTPCPHTSQMNNFASEGSYRGSSRKVIHAA